MWRRPIWRTVTVHFHVSRAMNNRMIGCSTCNATCFGTIHKPWISYQGNDRCIAQNFTCHKCMKNFCLDCDEEKLMFCPCCKVKYCNQCSAKQWKHAPNATAKHVTTAKNCVCVTTAEKLHVKTVLSTAIVVTEYFAQMNVSHEYRSLARGYG